MPEIDNVWVKVKTTFLFKAKIITMYYEFYTQGKQMI